MLLFPHIKSMICFDEVLTNEKYFENLLGEITFFFVFIIIRIDIEGLAIVSHDFGSSPQSSFNLYWLYY